MSIRNTVLQAIEFDGVRFNTVADSLEIPRTTLSRFVNEKRGIQFDFLERLCNHLNLKLTREIDDLEAYCRERWENGGQYAFRSEMESRKDDAWEEYVEENWEPDETEFEEYADQKWKEYAKTEWPEYADLHDLDVTDVDEVVHWRSCVRDSWLDEIREEWEEEAKEAWIEEEYTDWSEQFDERLEDTQQLFEVFSSELMDSIREQTWISVARPKQ